MGYGTFISYDGKHDGHHQSSFKQVDILLQYKWLRYDWLANKYFAIVDSHISLCAANTLY